MWPTNRQILQDKQRNVSFTAQPPHLTKTKPNLTKPETASSAENVWRKAFAQGSGNSNPNLSQKETPKSLAPQKAHSLWSSQTTKLDKENKSIAIQDSIGVGTAKRALKRRVSMYMRPDELTEIVSRVQKAIEPLAKKVRQTATVPEPKKSVKKTTDAAKSEKKKKEKTKQDQKEQAVKRARQTATVPQIGKVKKSKDERRLTTDVGDAVEGQGEFLRFFNLASTQQLAASTNRRSKRITRYKNDFKFS